MPKQLWMASLVAVAFAVPAASAPAADQAQTKETTKSQTQARDQVYGSQLMTRQERLEYRNRMRNLKTAEEREQLRLEHHKEMQERAKARGVSLPDEPPMAPAHMGPGGGAMGPGGTGPMGPGGATMGPGGASMGSGGAGPMGSGGGGKGR
jgi:hypothetical protein